MQLHKFKANYNIFRRNSIAPPPNNQKKKDEKKNGKISTFPVSNSHNTIPKLKTSALWSYGLCSMTFNAK